MDGGIKRIDGRVWAGLGRCGEGGRGGQCGCTVGVNSLELQAADTLEARELKKQRKCSAVVTFSFKIAAFVRPQ